MIYNSSGANEHIWSSAGKVWEKIVSQEKMEKEEDGGPDSVIPVIWTMKSGEAKKLSGFLLDVLPSQDNIKPSNLLEYPRLPRLISEKWSPQIS